MPWKYLIVLVLCFLGLNISNSTQAAVKLMIETKKDDPYPFMVITHSRTRGLHTGGSSEQGEPVFAQSNESLTVQPPMIMPALFSGTRYEVFNPDYIPMDVYCDEYASVVGLIEFGVINQIPIDKLFENENINSFKLISKSNYGIKFEPITYLSNFKTYIRHMDEKGTEIDYLTPLMKYKNILGEGFNNEENKHKSPFLQNYTDQIKEIEKLELLTGLGMKKRKEYYQFISSYRGRSDNIQEGLFNIFTNRDFRTLREILDKYIAQYYQNIRAHREDFVIDFESANKKYVYKVELEPERLYRDQVSWEARITIDGSKYFSEKLPGVKQIYKGLLVCNAKENYWRWGDYKMRHEACILPE